MAVGDVARFGVGADRSSLPADTWMNVPGISVVQLPFGIVEPQAASTQQVQALAREHRLRIRAAGPRRSSVGGLLRLADRDPAAMAVRIPKSDQVDALRRIARQLRDSISTSSPSGSSVPSASDVSTVLSREHIVGAPALVRDAELLARPPLDEDVLLAPYGHAASPRSPADEQR